MQVFDDLSCVMPKKSNSTAGAIELSRGKSVGDIRVNYAIQLQKLNFKT